MIRFVLIFEDTLYEKFNVPFLLLLLKLIKFTKKPLIKAWQSNKDINQFSFSKFY